MDGSLEQKKLASSSLVHSSWKLLLELVVALVMGIAFAGFIALCVILYRGQTGKEFDPFAHYNPYALIAFALIGACAYLTRSR